MDVFVSHHTPIALTERKSFVFGAVFLFAFLWTLPATMLIENQVYNLWDPATHFNNQVRIMHGAGTGHAWCFFSDFLGALWLALCPVKAIYWWFYLGGALINAVTCALFAILCRDLFLSDGRTAILCGIFGSMTPPVQFFLHISYNFVPRLLFVVLLMLSCLLFTRRRKFWPLFAMGACNLLLICARLTTLTLLAVPALLLVYTAVLNHWHRHPGWKSLWQSAFGLKKLLWSRQCHRWLLGWTAGFACALILMTALYAYYGVHVFDVAETQASGNMMESFFEFLTDAGGKSCFLGILLVLWIVWQSKLQHRTILYLSNAFLIAAAIAALLIIYRHSNAEYIEYLYESSNPLLAAAAMLIIFGYVKDKAFVKRFDFTRGSRLGFALLALSFWVSTIGAGSFIIYWMQSNTLAMQGIFFCQTLFLVMDGPHRGLKCGGILLALAAVAVLSYLMFSLPTFADIKNLKRFQSPEMGFFFHSNPKVVDEYDNAIALLRDQIHPGDRVYEYVPSFASRMTGVTTAMGGIPAFSYWRDVKVPEPGQIYADHLLIWHRNSNLHCDPTQNYFFPLDSINNALLMTGKYQLQVYNSAFSLYSSTQKTENNP